jgi:hypothetical protein
MNPFAPRHSSLGRFARVALIFPLAGVAVAWPAPLRDNDAADITNGCLGKSVRLHHAGHGTATFVGPAAFRFALKGSGHLSRLGHVTYHARGLVAIDGQDAFGLGIGAYRAPNGFKVRFNVKLIGRRDPSRPLYTFRTKTKFIGGTGKFIDSRGRTVETTRLLIPQTTSARGRVSEFTRGKGWISYARPPGDTHPPVFCNPQPIPFAPRRG